MLNFLVVLLVIFSAILLLILMVARFIQPEMLYAVRHALGHVKSTKAFLDYYDRRFVDGKRFPDLLGEDLRFETRDSDEEDVLSRVDKIRELYRVQVLKHLVPGVKKFGKPQICIVELAGMLVNLGREVKPERQFRYPIVDGERLLKVISDEIRIKNGQQPLKTVAEVEKWFTNHPISIEQVIEILISAIFGLSYRQRVQIKGIHEEQLIDETKADSNSEDLTDILPPVVVDSGDGLQPVEAAQHIKTMPQPELQPQMPEVQPPDGKFKR